MKKNKLVLISLGLFSLLGGCSKSLGRVEATEALDKIVLKLNNDFVIPATYSASYVSNDYINFKETKFSLDYTNTQKNQYVHLKNVVKQYESDQRSSEKVTYSITTSETYYYMDPLASEKTFISYSSTLNEYVSSEVSSSKSEPTATYKVVKGEGALDGFKDSCLKNKSIKSLTDSVFSIPETLDRYLKTLSSNANVYVKDSVYKTSGDGNLEMSIVTVEGAKESSVSASFDEYLIKQYDTVNSDESKSLSFKWNSAKQIYPDLNKASLESSSSDIGNFEN